MFGREKMIPVYMINGFLESGKTEFIKYTIAQPYFQSRQTTLLIVCEEGEIEYEAELLKKSRTVMEIIEDEEDFTIENLEKLVEKHKPGRIIVEYNGMWEHKNLYLPDNWAVEQQITTIDATTFPMFYTNMKSMVAEMVRRSSWNKISIWKIIRTKNHSHKSNCFSNISFWMIHHIQIPDSISCII